MTDLFESTVWRSSDESKLHSIILHYLPSSIPRLHCTACYNCDSTHTNKLTLSGCPTPQRITTYYLSPNRQRPLAGTFHAAFFNTFRRFRHQVLYVVPPFIAAYAAMNWANERYVLANTTIIDAIGTG